MTREDILKTAHQIVNGTRRDEYGSVEDSFQIIADYWSAYLGRKISSIDVANMMILMKIARLTRTNGNIDSYIDIAGYAACGGQLYDNGTPINEVCSKVQDRTTIKNNM